jgi:next-to-BRCA1 protein 1
VHIRLKRQSATAFIIAQPSALPPLYPLGDINHLHPLRAARLLWPPFFIAETIVTMASSSTTTPDTPVTIKINLDGTSRRFKLPLRDLGINVLEGKLRGLLNIPAETDAVFERYSDSAASYVVLDQANTAVYKQLGRAAKAKQKLKIRVTIKKPVVEEKKGPKPASVEDAVEEEVSTPKTAEAVEPTTTPAVSPSSTTVPQQTTSVTAAPERSEAQMRLESMGNTLEAIQASIMAAAASNKAVQQSMCGPSRAPIAFSMPPSINTSACKAPLPRTNYAVCCNRCDEIILGSHFHCSTCDDGDYDLCQQCVDQGKICNNSEHWMIKRCVENGIIVNSTTERIAPKPKPKPRVVDEAPAVPSPAPAPSSQERIIPIFNDFLYSSIRTCNCCVQELPEVEFVHCTTCDDFDLCRACFAKNRHGHHPKHAFVAAVEGTRLEPEVSRRLAAGRDQKHSAICDGCDNEIKGIRHKCLECPDWDYCSTCHENSSFIHPGHRFVPVYEPLEAPTNARIRACNRPTHVGICCDGPLCTSARKSSTYIIGDRYKCAVCHDTDFCASCEASPANDHNKTHPLIKFKTPVRHVSVTTTGEHENGRVMPAMGDRSRTRTSVTSSRSTETATNNVFTNQIQTVVDVKPSEPTAPVKQEEKEIKLEEVEAKPLIDLKAPVPDDLVAVFVRETVEDGTVFGLDHVFEQTWVLRNEGTSEWPAGCSVKYVGGDYMGHVDSNHPAATEDVVSSSESTICYAPIAPGEEFPFTVLLRTPHRAGRFVSNWRVTTKDGMKFGHRLWCDVQVEEPKPVKAEPEVVEKVAEPVVKEEKIEVQQSQMIFPKLDKESPVASVHEETQPQPAPAYEDDFEDCADDDAWAEDDSESFMTDEEYDILDASDEEYNVGKK